MKSKIREHLKKISDNSEQMRSIREHLKKIGDNSEQTRNPKPEGFMNTFENKCEQ